LVAGTACAMHDAPNPKAQMKSTADTTVIFEFI
jgi:hypothetical protein